MVVEGALVVLLVGVGVEVVVGFAVAKFAAEAGVAVVGNWVH